MHTKKLRLLLILVVFMGSVSKIEAQKVLSKFLDKETNQPVPYAKVQFSKHQAVISNEEGFFEFVKPENCTAKDSLEITSLGYKTKRLSLFVPIPEIIYLDTDIYKISADVVSNNNMPAIQIIDKVKQNLALNYSTSYTKRIVFMREIYKQRFNRLDFDLKKSTIDGINQNLFDTLINKIPSKFTSLVETYAESYLYDNSKGKMQLIKTMLIQSKHQKNSIKRIRDEFLLALQNNTKPNSHLIVKTGIARLDDTKSIDLSISQTGKPSKRDLKKMKLETQKNRNLVLNKLIKNLFFSRDSDVDFLSKPGRYRFINKGYVEYKNGLAYIIEFKPKGSSKYKGILYINTKDYAIVKAEVQGAKEIFDKHLNMFGISTNDLTYKNTTLFEKENDDRYHVKYIKTESTQEVRLNRLFKIIENDKFVKGRNTQNKVSFRMNVSLHNYDKKEIVFNRPTAIFESKYKNLELKDDFKIGSFTSYNKQFWNNYNILTPETAIQKLVIQD